PGAGDDLLLSPADEVQMVVEGGAAEDPLALGRLEVADLEDDRADLDQEDRAHQEDDDLLADGDGDPADEPAEAEAPGVAHEHLGGGAVPPEEAQARAGHGAGDDAELVGAGDVG